MNPSSSPSPHLQGQAITVPLLVPTNNSSSRLKKCYAVVSKNMLLTAALDAMHTGELRGIEELIQHLTIGPRAHELVTDHKMASSPHTNAIALEHKSQTRGASPQANALESNLMSVEKRELYNMHPQDPMSVTSVPLPSVVTNMSASSSSSSPTSSPSVGTFMGPPTVSLTPHPLLHHTPSLDSLFSSPSSSPSSSFLPSSLLSSSSTMTSSFESSSSHVPSIGSSSGTSISITLPPSATTTTPSARHRLKKKLYTQALERAATDKTNQVEILSGSLDRMYREIRFLRDLVVERDGRDALDRIYWENAVVLSQYQHLEGPADPAESSFASG
ncbi:hypothetical protein SpCBS45565_g06466 [Spizellomyces sp. 'palustris']|nr:hypothetical protein SpCBS45565_g06466 [Spizellomyces sp. 'palustris']